MNLRQALARTLVVATAIFAPSAFAATVTANLNVSAAVTGSCTMTAAPLNFGNVDVMSGSDVTSTANLTVTCTNGQAYAITMSAGNGSGATDTDRKMSDGSANTLNYQLFLPDGTTNWDSTTGYAGTGTGSAQTVTVNGTVPSGQTSVPTGTYSDTVVATLTFN